MQAGGEYVPLKIRITGVMRTCEPGTRLPGRRLGPCRIVGFSFAEVGKNGVGFRDFSKTLVLLCACIRVFVRMVLFRQLPVGGFDCVKAGCGGDAENAVIIFCLHWFKTQGEFQVPPDTVRSLSNFRVTSHMTPTNRRVAMTLVISNSFKESTTTEPARKLMPV